ncbi:MAG TPA: hypothetical protein VMU83_01820, partial [Hanamia sp.]|nr:hypothetical protein [Hanamia sp.]
MTSNRSLCISLQLKEVMRTDLLRNIDEGFPYHLIEGHQSATAKRDRIYNEENTLLTMLVTAIQEDKSLK